MILLGSWGEATDAEAAAQIRRAGSLAQDAVDRRVRLIVYPYLLEAVTSSDVLNLAARLAINAALDRLGISTPHLDVDEDGTLYVEPGTRTQRLGLDDDGVPAII
ncbi:hypothetical protein [Leucobacter tenebrionis]|uniref:hypothetical protein n=1 Tax=Leucobacter tenebrionis TaxID=2873270 RepID=UPI001CA72288|nr:hypothetical protein [Leucobacter tenebrionis]QZY52933.1 hypothetical protein KVY00_05725 [Leucobacter tenebrionis]